MIDEPMEFHDQLQGASLRHSLVSASTDSLSRPFSDRERVITAFLLFQLTIMFCWSMPFQSAPFATIRELTDRYVYFCGLWQSWDMFAPEPVSQLRRMDAKICFRDGSERTWEFFDSSSAGTIERWRKERHRKWAHENLRLDSNKRLWEPA